MSFLGRPSTSRLVPLASSSRSIHTSAPVLAKGPKKQTLRVALKRTNRFGKGKENLVKPVRTITRTIPKLTFSGASEIPDLSNFIQLHPDTYASRSVGSPTTFPQQSFGRLQTFGLPRKLEKEFAEGGSPASVVRQRTVDLARTLDAARSSSSADKRYMITGGSGTGKSMLLFQAVNYAIDSKWIVLYTPRMDQWIDSSSPYAYSQETKTFHQPVLAAKLLQTTLSSNQKALAGLRLGETLPLEGGQILGPDTDLAEVCKIGSRDERISVPVLEAFFKALGSQTEVPVVWAMDEVHSVFTSSRYRAPDFSVLESYHLSMPLLALDYLTGRKTFSRGIVLAAYSHSTPSLPIPPVLTTALALPSTHATAITPYTPLNPTHLAHASASIQRFQVPFGMSPVEAGGMAEIWQKKGWARPAGDEALMSGLSLSMGNPEVMGKGWRFDFKSMAV
ncbi:mitochondrial ribosomal death-associated protein 3-domain-containing protein [Naematelia encephala]|uniref:Small ribosomal subunit protein mS29 n=1 Tax=Naematelia encephala TaxID=71784 RepID=A0A1Y2AW14_9TREE|nr:mitochondrial ribosomal death-associated protein 3-domain-containing protein [Naematelia encephala]